MKAFFYLIIGDHYSEVNHPKLAAAYFSKAQEIKLRSDEVRKAAHKHEQLNQL